MENKLIDSQSIELNLEGVQETVVNEESNKKHELESGSNQKDEPLNKKIKLEEPVGIMADTNNDTVSLVSNNPAEVKAEIEELTNQEFSNTLEPKPLIKEDSITTKSSKNTTPVPLASREELVAQSERKTEDIIDGSDLRRFLNKSLSGYMIKGLDELVKLWESGELDVADMDDAVLKQKVVLKYSEILKKLVE